MFNKTISFISNYLILVSLFLYSNALFAQYKYTRFAIEASAGPNYGITSVPGSISASTEIGFRLSVSKYLSGKLSYGAGALRGSRVVDQYTFPLDNVSNYVDYNTTYRYINGRALINIERLFKLRGKSESLNRLNPFLIIGGGFMFPDIEVKRVDGQYKNYKKNVRFYTNCVGLDFRYFLSNRFDLLFGAEYHIIQTYYLDGAYSDEKLDKFATAHIGIGYNIGANADRKHLEWFNLDGKEDVVYKPIIIDSKKPDEPITSAEPKKDNETTNPNTEPVVIPQNADSVIAANEIAIEAADSIAASNDVKIDEKGNIVNEIPVVVKTDSTIANSNQPIVDIKSNEPTIKADSMNTIATNNSINTNKSQQQNIPTKTIATTNPTISPSNKQQLDKVDVILVTPPLGTYNVIAATYKGPKYALIYCKTLRNKGFDAHVIKSTKSKMHRVSIYYGNDRTEALKQLNRIRTELFSTAWIHVYR